MRGANVSKLASFFGYKNAFTEITGIGFPRLYADLTIFDEKRLAVTLDKADSTPGGVMYTVVNGQFAVDNGTYRTQHAGAVLSKA